MRSGPGKRTAVTAFSFYVHDRRYSVPMLEFMIAADVAAATELARRRLAQTPDYLSIDVYDHDALVASVAGPEAG